jgi:putative dehydrogenase
MGEQVVGVVGLGLMGSAISANLVDAGWSVIGYDVQAHCLDAHVERGGVAARSPREVAQAAPILITSLPSNAALQAVIGDSDTGLAAVTGTAVLVIETSTLALADKHAARASALQTGHDMLDCPLSGTAAQARTRDLAVYASGGEQAYLRCIPVFEGFARSTTHVGEFGNGSKMKFVANLLVAIHNVAAAEALVLGMKAGLDVGEIYRVIADGAGNSRMFEIRGPMMVEGVYDEATMKNSVWQKDLRIISEFAAGLDCPTPLLSSSIPLYSAAMARGHEDHDTAAVCEVLENMAGLQRRK